MSLSCAVDGPVHAVMHLASPASPIDYLRIPIETLRVGSLGTLNALELAQASRRALRPRLDVGDLRRPARPSPARELLGQREPHRPARACTTRANGSLKLPVPRTARERGVDTAIARIFNTYGPRMRPYDGRAIPSFVVAALRGEPLLVHGDGTQTRSVCFVDDTVRGLVALLESGHPGPVNLGSARESTVAALAATVLAAVGGIARSWPRPGRWMIPPRGARTSRWRPRSWVGGPRWSSTRACGARSIGSARGCDVVRGSDVVRRDAARTGSARRVGARSFAQCPSNFPIPVPP